jgi:hypothetical protein
MPISQIDYKGLTIPSPLPAQAGGLLLINDLKEMADRSGTWHSSTSAPTADNDADDTAGLGKKFYVNSQWVQTASPSSNNKIWFCLDNTTGAAVWKTTGSSSSESSSNSPNTLVLRDSNGDFSAGDITSDSVVVGSWEITATNIINSAGGNIDLGGGNISDAISIAATSFSGSGASLTSLNASNISSGSLALARGGLATDASAFSGLVKITGGTSSAVTAPAGAVVGTTDAQALTNKTIDVSANTVTNISSGNVIVGLVSGQTTDTAPVGAADYVMTYDASANALKKVLLNNIGDNATTSLTQVELQAILDDTDRFPASNGLANHDGDSGGIYTIPYNVNGIDISTPLRIKSTVKLDLNGNVIRYSGSGNRAIEIYSNHVSEIADICGVMNGRIACTHATHPGDGIGFDSATATVRHMVLRDLTLYRTKTALDLAPSGGGFVYDLDLNNVRITEPNGALIKFTGRIATIDGLTAHGGVGDAWTTPRAMVDIFTRGSDPPASITMNRFWEELLYGSSGNVPTSGIIRLQDGSMTFEHGWLERQSLEAGYALAKNSIELSGATALLEIRNMANPNGGAYLQRAEIKTVGGKILWKNNGTNPQRQFWTFIGQGHENEYVNINTTQPPLPNTLVYRYSAWKHGIAQDASVDQLTDFSGNARHLVWQGDTTKATFKVSTPNTALGSNHQPFVSMSGNAGYAASSDTFLKQLSKSDLASNNSTTVTSAGGGFTADMVGCSLWIGSGSNFTAGAYRITTFTNSTTIVVDRNPTNGGSATGGTGWVGIHNAVVLFVIRAASDPAGTNGTDGRDGFSGDASGNETQYPNTSGSIEDGTFTGTRKTVGNLSAALTNWHIYSARSSPTEWTAKLNGDRVFTTATNFVNYNSSNFAFGRDQYGFGSFFNGDIAEIWVFTSNNSDSALTDDEERQLTRHFKDLYAIT